MKIGDVVRLKSGGPWLTISDQSETSGKWWCLWFPNEGPQAGVCCRAEYPEETLELQPEYKVEPGPIRALYPDDSNIEVIKTENSRGNG